MKAILAAAFLALCLGCLQPVSAAEDASRLIKQKAEETNTALVKGDYGKVADLTHPKLVEQLGVAAPG